MYIKETELFTLPNEEIEGIYTHAAARRFAVELKNKMIVDGKFQDEFDGIVSFQFSLNGAQYAYIAKKGKKSLYIKNGEILNEYDSVKSSSLIAGPNGRFAFSARLKNDVWVVVEDQKYGPLEDHPGDDYQQTSALAFDTTGTKIAYAGKRNEKYALEINGERVDEEFSFARSISFSKDGKVAYRGVRNREWFIVYNNLMWGPYKTANSPVISPDGNHCGYTAEIKEGSFACIDGKSVAGPYADIGLTFYFTDSGCAYEAEEKSQDESTCAFSVINGKKGPVFESTRGLVLSKNGKKAAYIAVAADGEYLVSGEEKYGPYEDIDHPPSISQDGNNVACLVLEDENFVLVNGKSGPKFEGMYGEMHWSEDGNILRYIIVKEKKLYLIEHYLAAN